MFTNRKMPPEQFNALPVAPIDDYIQAFITEPQEYLERQLANHARIKAIVQGHEERRKVVDKQLETVTIRQAQIMGEARTAELEKIDTLAGELATLNAKRGILEAALNYASLQEKAERQRLELLEQEIRHLQSYEVIQGRIKTLTNVLMSSVNLPYKEAERIDRAITKLREQLPKVL